MSNDGSCPPTLTALWNEAKTTPSRFKHCLPDLCYRVSLHTLHLCCTKLWSLSLTQFGTAHNKVLRYRLKGYLFLCSLVNIAKAQTTVWSRYEHGFRVQGLMILWDMHEPKRENFSSWTNYPSPSHVWHMGCCSRKVCIKSIKLHRSWDPLSQGQHFTHRSTSITPLKHRDDAQLAYYRRQLQVDLTPLHPKTAQFCRTFLYILAY